MSEKEKMLAGKVYDSLNRELVAERKAARTHILNYNKTLDSETFRRERFLRRLLGKIGTNSNVEPSIYFEFGVNSYIGENFICGKGLTVLDMGRVTIGTNCFFGTDVSISTQIRSFHPEERKQRVKGNRNYAAFEYSRPVKIGSDVWIGNSVVINPGSSIGDGAVIMSGSVVTGAIAPNSIAAGFPCKVLREVLESDKILGDLDEDFADYLPVVEIDDFKAEVEEPNVAEIKEIEVDLEDEGLRENPETDVDDTEIIGESEDDIAQQLAMLKDAEGDAGVATAAELSRQIGSEGTANQFNEKMFSFEDIK